MSNRHIGPRGGVGALDILKSYVLKTPYTKPSAFRLRVTSKSKSLTNIFGDEKRIQTCQTMIYATRSDFNRVRFRQFLELLNSAKCELPKSEIAIFEMPGSLAFGILWSHNQMSPADNAATSATKERLRGSKPLTHPPDYLPFASLGPVSASFFPDALYVNDFTCKTAAPIAASRRNRFQTR
jgi:hypothetical protein